MAKVKMKRVAVRKRSCTDLVRERFEAIETAKAAGTSYNKQWTELYDAGEPVGKNPTTFNEAIKKVRFERASADTPDNDKAPEASAMEVANTAPADVVVDSPKAEPIPPAQHVDYTDTRCRSDW